MADKIKESDIVEGNIWKDTTEYTKALILQVEKLEKALKDAATIAQKKLGLADEKDFDSLKKSNEQIDILNKALAAKIKLEKESAGLKSKLAKLYEKEAAAEKKAIDEVAKKDKAAKDERLKNAQKLIADKRKKTAEAKKLAEQEAAAEEKAAQKEIKAAKSAAEAAKVAARQKAEADVKLRNARIKAFDDFDKKEAAAQARSAKEAEIAANKKIAADKREAAAKKSKAIEERKANKEAQKTRKIAADSANAFKRLTKQTNNAQARFKRLAAQYGQTDKRTQKALKTFNKLDAKLRSINQTARDGRRDVGRYGTAFTKVISSFKNIALGLGVVQIIRGIGRVFTNAARRVIEFDKELQNIAGITGSTRSSLKDLEESIVSVSKSSIRTSVEVAKLATTLFTLGKTKEEVKFLLKPVNDLSIAFGVNADAAADFLGQTLNAFGKSAEFASNFADIIANVRTSTSLDFERIKDGLGFIAPTANALNLTLGETSALLGVLQDNGVRAARAGRLLNSSFARILDKGLTLDDALEKINKSQNRITTSSELFGKEALALGLILADNTEKTADLANEFDNLSSGSLDELTSRQLDSLSAKLTILDSSWEALVLSIENGTGGLSVFFKEAITGVTNVFNILRRYNQTFQQNLKEDVEENNKDFIKILQFYTDKNVAIEEKKYKDALAAAKGNVKEQKRLTKEYNIFLEGATEEQKARRQKDRDEEIAAETKRYADREIDLEQYNKNVEKIEEKYRKSIEGARNASYRAYRDELKQSVSEDSESLGINAKEAERLLEELDSKRRRSEDEEAAALRGKTGFINANVTQYTEQDKIQAESLRKIVEEKDQIRQINILLKQIEEIKPPLLLTTDGAGKTKALIGLINNQAKKVADLNKEIQEAVREGGDAKAIEELGFKYADAVKELERLRRVAFSTREEFEQQEIDLIEDGTERQIAKLRDRTDKLIESIRTNTKATEEERLRLELEAERDFEDKATDLEIKKGQALIKLDSDLAKARFEQKRSGFKTEEKFEKEKAEQFKAIRIKAIDEEIELLEIANQEKDQLRIQQLKAERESYFEFAKERVKIEVDVIALLEALNEKYFSSQLDKVDRQISDLEKREANLQDLANRGNEEAAASLAQSQKDQAKAARKKEDLLQREKQFELALAIIGAFNAELDQVKSDGTKQSTGESLAKAITSTSVLTSYIQAIPFFDGTEDTGSGGNVDGKGGFHAILHPNERVVSKKENMKMGGVSNETAANIVHDFNNDLLSYNTPQLTVQKSNWDSNEQVLQKFDELKKDLVSAINNKETYLGSDIDTMKKIILQSYQKGSTKTTVKSKYPTRR